MPQGEQSIDKICFIPANRNVIIQCLDNLATINRTAYYLPKVHDDFNKAISQIKSYLLPKLGFSYHQNNTHNGTKHLMVSMEENTCPISLSQASSGIQSAFIISLLVDYLCYYNDASSIEDYYPKGLNIKEITPVKISGNDTEPMGEIKKRGIHLSIEEPENSLDPSAQCSLLERFIRTCNSAIARNVKVMISTHSPYIINYLNVLLHKKGQTGIEVSKLGVYNVAFGKLQPLLAKDVDTGL